MNSWTLTNQERQELKDILLRIQKSFQNELNTPISNSSNVAMNFSMMRTWNQMNQTFRKLCTEVQSFIKNLSSCTILNLRNFDQTSSKSLNQIQTFFKSLANQMQTKVAAHQQAKKKNPYAVGPTKAVISQAQEILASFFTHFNKLNLQFQLINQKFIQKGKKIDPNIKGSQINSDSQAPIQALEKVKEEIQFLYKSLYGSFQTATYLGLGRLWNQMMKTYQQLSDMTNGIVKNKASCNQQTVEGYYQNAMKSAYDIHSSVKQMMDELQKKKNTPMCSNSLIAEAQNCQSSIVGYLEKIRNQLKTIKSKYPNIKESNFQGFKKQPSFRRVQIDLIFKELSKHMEDSKLKDLLDGCVRQYLAKDEQKQKIAQMKFQAGKMQVILEVQGLLQSQIQMFKGQLKRNLQKLIEFNQFNTQNSRVLKKMLGTFSDEYLLFTNQNGRIFLVARPSELKQKITFITNQINKNLKPTIKDFCLKQRSQLTLSKKFLEKKLNQAQYSDVQVRYDEGKQIRITFFGQLLFINDLITALQEFIETLQGKILDFNLNLTDEELSIIQQDEGLRKHIESNWNLTVKFNRNQITPAQINIQPHSSLGPNLPQKQIKFQTYFNFDSLPINSLFFFKDRKQLQTIKRSCIQPFKKLIQDNSNKNPLNNGYIAHKDQQRQCIYFYANQYNPLQVLLQSEKNNLLSTRHIFMYLPDTKTFKTKLIKIIQRLCQGQDLIKCQAKITFICKKNQNIQSILGFKEGKNSCKPQIGKKWFALDDKNKLYYSQKGTQKIQNAIQKKIKEVELTNEDLNLEVATHSFDFKRNVMIHAVTKKQFPITVYSDKITFSLCGLEKTVPDSQFQKIPRIQGTNKFSNCSLSIGFYHIDLVNKIQTNLFSVFQRKIDSENIQTKAQLYNFTILYDLKTTNLVLQYAQENSKHLKTAVSYIKQNLNKRLIQISQPLNQQFTLQSIQKFLDDAKQQNITIYLSNDKKSAVFRAYNDKNIKNFIKMLCHLSQVGKLQVEFPKQWQPQTQQIQTFIVPKNTTQFLNVQKAFTTGNIVELVRIQNKLIFKKFYEEKLFLKQLNTGKQIKQMLLYHGTSTADPKIIYEDKQESFNINYTSENNFLGKGTYFAQRSQYSLNYSHLEDNNKKIYSMFYCRVLVGDSQKCPKLHVNYRDTSFKDEINRIRYESMTQFLNGSNVFVVYKNRRAYPSYLIKFTIK